MKVFQLSITAGFSIIIFILFSAFGTYAESLFITDGSIIEGKITTQSNTSLTVLTPGQLKIEVPKTSILRIPGSDEYKKKLNLVKTDGTHLSAHIVDQDATTFTIRSDLTSKNEQKISKNDIKEILYQGKPARIDSVASIKEPLSPKRAAQLSINPLQSGSFTAKTNGWGIAFCFIKTGSLALPLSIMLGSAFGSPGGEDSMSNDSGSYDYMEDKKTKTLMLGSLGVWLLATAGDMIYSYHYVKNHNEKQQKASLESGAIRFSVIPKINFTDNVYTRKANCDGVYVAISASF